MKLFYYLGAALWAVSTVSGNDLPPEVQRLKEQRDRKISEIDEIYVGELEALLQKYAKQGDLAKANAISEIIETVRKKSALSLPETDAELTEFLSGTKWDFGDKKVITFHHDGNIRKSWGKLKPGWEVKNMKVLIGGGSDTIHFLKDFTEASKIDKNGVREYGKIVIENQ